MSNREVIIALDFDSLDKTCKFLNLFENQNLFVKIGMELFYQNGLQVLHEIKNRGHKIFLDLKLHDIPNTVYHAVKGLMKFDVDIITVHCAGGFTMLNQAKQAVLDQNKNTKIIGITQLTSTSETEMQTQQKILTSLQDSVLNYAKLAKEANIDGVVSSVWETKKIKEQNGNNFLVINPGIRLEKDDSGDQKRVASPLDAKNQLADFIVVGRPITKDNNPLEKYLEIKRMFV